MTLHVPTEAKITCDAGGCRAEIVSKVPRTEAKRKGWVYGQLWRPRLQPLALDFCPEHAHLLPEEYRS